MNHGGRPQHCYWDEGNLKKIKKKDDKTVALCLYCNKILANTSKSRLINHR